jgi:heparanase
MYIRVSGTWANTTYFQNDDLPKLTKAPEGYQNVLTHKEWKGVIDFVNAFENDLVTSFAISDGMRDENGNWTPAQIKPLLEYTRSIGGKFAAAEMFNEPSHADYGGTPEGYDPAWYARDFEAFSAFVKKEIPAMKIMGPGSTGEGGILGEVHEMATDKILSQTPKPEFEIFSYHYYGGVSTRCRGNLSPKDALSPEWLSRMELGLEYYQNARNTHLPNAPIWLTETAEAACGGNPWAATYIDTFRYLEQLGRLAKKGVKVVMHNTLAASEYALLEQYTFNPRPNYWAALLWSKFMGTKVYESPYQVDGLDIFVHSLKNSEKGYSILVVNPTEKESSLQLSSPSMQYRLNADELLGKTVKLNEKELKLGVDDSLPEIGIVHLTVSRV